MCPGKSKHLRPLLPRRQTTDEAANSQEFGSFPSRLSQSEQMAMLDGPEVEIQQPAFKCGPNEGCSGMGRVGIRRTARSPILSRACIAANKDDRGTVGSSIHSRTTNYTTPPPSSPLPPSPLGGCCWCCCIADATLPPALWEPLPVAASLPTSSGSFWVSGCPFVRPICGLRCHKI